MQDKTIKYIDLFSGIGGFRMAIQKAAKNTKTKIECVGFSEIDPYAIKTYKANFKDDKNELDMGDISIYNSDEEVKKLPDFNLLVAGFPCQPFSLMGSKGGFKDKRGNLFFSIVNIIKHKEPDFFILENVRGLKTHEKGKTFEKIIDILTNDLGYNVRAEIFNSADFGTPQVRRRLYFVGIKNKNKFNEINSIQFPLPIKNVKYKTVWHLLEKNVDEKYYLSKKLIKTILSHGSGNYWSKSEINRLLARPLTASMHKMHRANQDNYYSNDFIYGKYSKDKIIPNEEYDKSSIRRITPIEAFRLQGFNDVFVEKAKEAGVSDTQLYRQAGNAITVNVAEQILKSLFINN